MQEWSTERREKKAGVGGAGEVRWVVVVGVLDRQEQQGLTPQHTPLPSQLLTHKHGDAYLLVLPHSALF